MFVEPAGGAGTSATTAHPVDLVLDSFKTAEAAKATTEKLQNFLEDAMKIHEKKMELAPIPATRF